MPAITTIKLRRGTAAQWTSANPVLAAGEVGLETDTYKTKYGDGSTAWTSLPYSVATSSGGASVDWTDVLNKPVTFPPSAHTHVKADVTDFAHTHVKADVTDFAHTHVIADITDLTATAAELNVLDGITATTAELNFVDGVTSNIQTQLDGKAANGHTHTVSNITDLTATATELNYTDGVTSNLQTQLDGKAPLVETVSSKIASYTIVAGDKYSTIRSTSTAITITIANVLTVGQYINFAQYGAGQITFAAGSGVTLNSVDGKLKTNKQYSGASVMCVASGVYWLFGDLAA